MKPIAIATVSVGVIILIFPAIVAYVLAIILIAIGGNMIFGGQVLGQKQDGSFKVGEYEVFKGKK